MSKVYELFLENIPPINLYMLCLLQIKINHLKQIQYGSKEGENETIFMLNFPKNGLE